MYKIKILLTLIIVHLALIIGGKTAAQDFGIFSLAAKTNMDSTDALMLMQKVDSSYYKLLWDRVVDSVEDSIRGNIINSWIKSNAAIAFSKMATGTAGYVLLANGSGVPTYTNLSGDVTINSSGVTTIGASTIGSSEITNDQIVNADINSSAAIAYSKLNLTGSIVSADITDGVIVNADINSSAAIAYSKLNLTGSIVNADINGGAAIELDKLEAGIQSQIIVTDDHDIPIWVSVTGDISLDYDGSVDIADNLADNFSYTGSSSYVPETFTPTGTTTVSASGVKIMLFQLDANSATITDFASGTDGQEIIVINSNTSTFSFAIDHGSEIVTNTQADKTISPGETISFVYVAAVDLWYEIGQ